MPALTFAGCRPAGRRAAITAMTDVTPTSAYDPEERFVEGLLEDADRDRAEVAAWSVASPPFDGWTDDLGEALDAWEHDVGGEG